MPMYTSPDLLIWNLVWPNSNQGGIKSALTGKAAANVKGKIGKMLEKVGLPSMRHVDRL